ncbi:MAG: molybdenum cofactor guanylyltransferase [Phenylobacterium sp.]|uniref:molybdenum cofactor guanylyltransferase n=1 Tax=Phenylobacterium sp. TaxID=1871053 RepID=UPI003918E29E
MSAQRLCVVLAGGAGERMGGGKPQRLLNGRPLGEHALRLAAGFADHLALSVRDAGQAAGLPPALLLFDPDGVEGPLAGVAAALDHAAGLGVKHVLIIPCDAPRLPADLYCRLEAALDLAPRVLAAFPSDGHRDHPACGLWRPQARQSLTAYLAHGGRSLKGLLREIGACRVAWSAEASGSFVNLNTPADLARCDDTADRQCSAA